MRDRAQRHRDGVLVERIGGVVGQVDRVDPAGRLGDAVAGVLTVQETVMLSPPWACAGASPR